MVVYSVVGLLAFLALVAALFVRFVLTTVDREFRDLARAAADPERRREELAKVDSRLAPLLPVPDGAEPLPRPGGGWLRLLPAVFLALGVILFWGGLFAPPRDRAVWLIAGGACAAVSACVMLATLRKRRRERFARLLRVRADLRDLDGDYSGSAADLEQLLRLTPWDDVAWSELAEALRGQGDDEGALAAWEKATELDPDYEDYHAAAAGAAIRLGRYAEVERLLAAWEDRSEGSSPGSAARLTAFRSAAALARGDENDALVFYRHAVQLDPDAVKVSLDLDSDLAGLARFEEAGAGTAGGRE